MNITRHFGAISNNRHVDEDTISINFDIQTLNLFCMYIMSENAYIRTTHLSTMKKLFDRIDLQRYLNDPDKMLRVEFIQRGLEGRLNKKIKNKDLLQKYINGGFDDKPLFVMNFSELGTDEIDWINSTITESIQYAFMYDYVTPMMDICTRFRDSDYNHKSDIVHEFEELIDKAKRDFRRVKNESMTEAEFSLAEGVFEEIVYDIYQRETNPSRRLSTGMQGFNELCGGGLESGRCYMLFGMAGAGKSLTMLNLAYQIKIYNKAYICKDPTKKPAVVILTMENSVHETVTRLFSIIAGDRMGNYAIDEVIEKLRVDGELFLNDESPIDIIIKYKPNMSVDTTYLYTLYDDLDDRGYEMICLLQDHIKRIRPANNRHDLRLDLGEIVNDFKVFAIEKDIPVISDSHLNRDGARVIDTAISANKQDVTRLLGRSNVGESMLMIDNCDCGILLNKEYDSNGKEYMIFFRQKMRDACSKRDYIAQPFVEGSTIRLMEDLYSPIPSFKDSLYAPVQLNSNGMKKNDYNSNIQKIDDDDDSLFKPSPNIVPATGVIPTPIALSTMNFEMIGSPSTPVYNNYQDLTEEAEGFFDMVVPIAVQDIEETKRSQMIPALLFMD